MECKEGEGQAPGRKGGGEEAPPPDRVKEGEEEDKAKAVTTVVTPKPFGLRIKQEPSDDIKVNCRGTV